MKRIITLFDRCLEFGSERVSALKEKEFKGLTIISLPLSLLYMKICLHHNRQGLDESHVFDAVKLLRV